MLRASPVEKPCPSCMTASKGNLQLQPCSSGNLWRSPGAVPPEAAWSLQNSKAWNELFDIISCHKLITAKLIINPPQKRYLPFHALLARAPSAKSGKGSACHFWRAHHQLRNPGLPVPTKQNQGPIVTVETRCDRPNQLSTKLEISLKVINTPAPGALLYSM